MISGQPRPRTAKLGGQGVGHGPGPARGPVARDYVLFTDADIAWEAPDTLRRLVAAAEGDDRDLVSQMALLRAATGWERVVVPAFVYFFAQLYPFRRVNVPGSRTAAAAGGCMLVRRGALDKAGGLAPIRGALIDDVALGRLVKGQRGRSWLGPDPAGGQRAAVPGAGQPVADGGQVGLHPAALLPGGAGRDADRAAVPVRAAAGRRGHRAGRRCWPAAAGGARRPVAVGAGLAGWALMSLSYLPMLRLYRLSPLRAPGLPLIALLYAAMTADSARRHYAGRGAEWRGRARHAAMIRRAGMTGGPDDPGPRWM